MEPQYKEAVRKYLEKIGALRPLQEPTGGLYIRYGTAGFRAACSLLDFVFQRIGIISALMCMHEQADIGLMITASHNPPEDNGVKIINKKGEMIDSDWEKVFEKFCNTVVIEESLAQLEEVISKYSIDTKAKCRGRIFIGRDTRESCKRFIEKILACLVDCSPNVIVHQFGKITTPMLHFLVASFNSEAHRGTSRLDDTIYYEKIYTGVQKCIDFEQEKKNYKINQLMVDCANGVGGTVMKNLNLLFCQRRLMVQPIRLICTSETLATLNVGCGADFVKTKKLPSIECDLENFNRRYASFDGDADRLIYYYLERSPNVEYKLHLLDGDKILCLFGLYLKDMLKKYDLEQELTLGFVQTAYSNGASTEYLKNVLGVKVDVADTGVKNLHKMAITYDVGVYFEANGHGTIWLSPKAVDLIKAKHCTNLKNLIELLNNYTGDAISDLFIVESILHYYDWDIKRWDQLYQDRPNGLDVAHIHDNSIVTTTNAGQTCVTPSGLQEEIDRIVASFGDNARSFVRPSGTEPGLRVYAEAKDHQSVKDLIKQVKDKCESYCGKYQPQIS